MKVINFICDRCGEAVPEDDVTRVNFSHGKGRFDLRDENIELCSVCDAAAIEWLTRKVNRP